MPKAVIIALFVAIIAPLAIMVWWEFTRARGAPPSVSKAFKRHLDAQAALPQTRAAKETKRGFDAWN